MSGYKRGEALTSGRKEKKRKEKTSKGGCSLFGRLADNSVRAAPTVALDSGSP
jgi:hypothetical protein